MFLRTYELYIKLHDEKKLPVYFLRYEDLVADRRGFLEELFCFLLSTNNVENMNIQRRIKLVCGEDTQKLYKLKDGGVKVNKNAKYYDQEKLDHIMQRMAKVLHFFGYNEYDGNPTGFYKFNEYLSKSYGKY